ncbi:unnamed protein product, partial [Timema podura]|nr:unnamed protein product [Timema podura]
MYNSSPCPSWARVPPSFELCLQRHDICSDNMTECGLMGIAFIGEICNTDKSSCMCEDSGLMLAPVVTHEMGHV